MNRRKKKAKSILEQEKSGKLTREQAKEELTKLGVKFPEKGKHKEMFAGLDEQAKEKSEVHFRAREIWKN